MVFPAASTSESEVHGRNVRQALLPPPCPITVSPNDPQETGTNAMESRYLDTTTMSMLCAMAQPRGWFDLPDLVLHSIIKLLSCTRDILAFIATCRHWRSAFMQAKPSLCSFFPPLMIQSCAQLSNLDDPHTGAYVHHTWQLMDPANPSLRFHRPVPSTIPPGMEFVGCSYGHAIFADLSVSDTGGRITMIDVFTGVQVSPPPCPELAEESAVFGSIDLLCCTLTAPISSPKAYLLVSSIASAGLLHVWRIGSDDWVYAETDGEDLGFTDQIVVFKGKIILLDGDLNLFRVYLDDARLGTTIRALPVIEEGDNNNGEIAINSEELMYPRLVVVCGKKLAMVGSPWTDCERLVFFYLEIDDSLTGPARWSSPVPELDCAVFISGGLGNQVFHEGSYGRWALSSDSPERWGRRRGHVDFAGHGKQVYPFSRGRLLPSWVSPDVLSLDG